MLGSVALSIILSKFVKAVRFCYRSKIQETLNEEVFNIDDRNRRKNSTSMATMEYSQKLNYKGVLEVIKYSIMGSEPKQRDFEGEF